MLKMDHPTPRYRLVGVACPGYLARMEHALSRLGEWVLALGLATATTLLGLTALLLPVALWPAAWQPYENVIRLAGCGATLLPWWALSAMLWQQETAPRS